ncbi:hypothetical protein QFZ32_005117 [Streptomyces canus]|nr:hypothetical protein [Streptomyces canus]
MGHGPFGMPGVPTSAGGSGFRAAAGRGRDRARVAAGGPGWWTAPADHRSCGRRRAVVYGTGTARDARMQWRRSAVRAGIEPSLSPGSRGRTGRARPNARSSTGPARRHRGGRPPGAAAGRLLCPRRRDRLRRYRPRDRPRAEGGWPGLLQRSAGRPGRRAGHWYAPVVHGCRGVGRPYGAVSSRCCRSAPPCGRSGRDSRSARRGARRAARVRLGRPSWAASVRPRGARTSWRRSGRTGR